MAWLLTLSMALRMSSTATCSSFTPIRAALMQKSITCIFSTIPSTGKKLFWRSWNLMYLSTLLAKTWCWCLCGTGEIFIGLWFQGVSLSPFGTKIVLASLRLAGDLSVKRMMFKYRETRFADLLHSRAWIPSGPRKGFGSRADFLTSVGSIGYQSSLCTLASSGSQILKP